LKLSCDQLLLTLAFNFNLRRYIKAAADQRKQFENAAAAVQRTEAAAEKRATEQRAQAERQSGAV
jgi:hypothetical protein